MIKTPFDETKYEVLKEHRFPDPWDNSDSGTIVKVFRYDGGRPKVSILRYFKDKESGEERISSKGSIPSPTIGKVGEALQKIQEKIDSKTEG